MPFYLPSSSDTNKITDMGQISFISIEHVRFDLIIRSIVLVQKRVFYFCWFFMQAYNFPLKPQTEIASR